MRFSIGEFSRITALTIKSLRLYHEKELLIPAEIDEFTGYRYYNETNYEAARTIKILKELDFSLAEIKEILEDCKDEMELVTFLEKKILDVEQKIHQYAKISRSIKLILQREKESAMKINGEFEIEEKEIETILIAGYRMKGKYQEMGKGFGILGKEMGRHINGKAMTLYYDNEYKETDANFEVCFPVRKGKDVAGISVRELKGGKAVCLIHKGPYENLSESYKKLYAYLNEKDCKTIIPSREIYLKGPGMIFKGNPKNYLTEIIVLVE